MKTHLFITLSALAILILACSSFSMGPASTPTPNDMPIQPALTPTLVFKLISTEIPTLAPALIPTLVPTIEPNATASPINTLAIPVDDASTPTASNYPSALITNISISVTKNFTSCAGTTPVSVTSYITSNNQTILQYKWLLSGTQSQNGAPRKTDMLSTAGTISLSINYKLKCGNYSIYFQVIYPNFVTGKKHFSIP
jgi:hypothetical protein